MNPTVKRHKSDVSSTDFNLVKDNADRALFLASMSFKYKNSFYFNKNAILTKFENLIDNNIHDLDYIYALAWYTGSVLGLRLAPTILVSRLIANGKTVDYRKIKYIVNAVFTRPDFIANSMAYIQRIKLTPSISNLPSEYKTILRNKLSTFSEVTLKKGRLKRRNVKLADLIKILKPRPVNAKISKLYKDIIENNKDASLVVVKDESGKVVSADHITAVLSDNTVNEASKLDYVEDNLRTIPINALIKNMAYVADSATNMNIIAHRIDSIFTDSDALRFLNPFDLIMIGKKENYDDYHFNKPKMKVLSNSKFSERIDKVLMKNIVNQIDIKAKCPLIMFDISGSMGMHGCEPAIAGIKTLSLLLPILGRFVDDLVYIDFGTNLHDNSDVIKPLLSCTPHQVAKGLVKHYKSFPEGTRLIQCLQKAIRTYYDKIDSVIIISDEMSWADSKEALSSFRDTIPEKLHDKSFLFNVNYSQCMGETAIEPSASISRVSGTDAKSLFLMEAMFNFDNFKQKLITSFDKR